VEKEKARLSAELEKTQKEIARVEGKLSNEEFVKKAPEKVVNAERAKLDGYRRTLENLTAAMEKLK
jgi:valyl-tRNA synthetase